MENIVKLKERNYPRRYAIMLINGKTKLACQVNGEWIVDATCKTINEMLEIGLVSEHSVTGWITNQVMASH